MLSVDASWKRRGADVVGALLLAAGSFVFDATLIHDHPAMYWADGVARAVGRDRLLIDRWLPLLQALVFGVGRVTSNLELLRLALAAVGALAVLAAAALGKRLSRGSASAVFAMLLATNLLFVGLTIVPYQEVLFAGLIFAGLALDGRHWTAALAFNLACVTRYEAWLLVVILSLFELREETVRRGLAKGIRASLRVLARYGLAAAGWLALLAVLGDVGRVWATPGSRPGSFDVRAHEYLRQCGWQLGSPLIVGAAMAGLVASLVRPETRSRHARIVCFVAVCVAYVLLAGPYSGGSLRQTFIPVVFALLYAAIGIDLAVERGLALVLGVDRAAKLRSAASVVLGSALAVVSARGAERFVAACADEFVVPYTVGTWFGLLSAEERQDARVALLGPHDTDSLVIALYSGLPETRVTDMGDIGRLDETTHVVSVQRPGEALTGTAMSLARRLENGEVKASPTRIGSAVIWTLARPQR